MWPNFAERLTSSERSVDPRTIYRIFVEEVLIDAQCAFYNAYSQAAKEPQPQARQFFHLDRLMQLLDSGVAPTDVICLAPALRDRIQAYEKTGDWPDAITSASELLRRYPQEKGAVELKAGLLFERGIARLSKVETESTYRQNAKSLEQPIEDLEKFCAEYPDFGVSYEFVAHLKHIQAVNLANAGQPSDALLANEQAIAYWPLEEAERDRDKLSELMHKTIAAAQEMLHRVAITPNAHLTSDGLRLKNQAQAGFEPANQFVQSERAKQISQQAYSARIRSIWRRVGLHPPADRWDEHADKLIKGMVRVQELSGNVPERIEGCWLEVAKDDQDLNALPSSLIRQFLVNGEVATRPESSTAGEAPMLPVSSGAKKRGNEPFKFWVFSRQDLFLKAQAVAAVVVVVLALSLSVHYQLQVNAREASWVQAKHALLAGDDLGIIQDCEAFFAASPPASDPRVSEAREVYEAALVRWFAKMPASLDSDSLGHVQRYKQISARWPKAGADGGAK
jgi:hypothetical protein